METLPAAFMFVFHDMRLLRYVSRYVAAHYILYTTNTPRQFHRQSMECVSRYVCVPGIRPGLDGYRAPRIKHDTVCFTICFCISPDLDGCRASQMKH